MSGARKVAAAVAAAAALVALVVVTEVVLPRRERARLREQALLLDVSERPRSYVIERPDGRFELRARQDGAWDVVSGDDVRPADSRFIETLRRALAGVMATELVGPAADADLDAHGLAPPRCTLHWTRPGGRSWSLSLGATSLDRVHALTGAEIVLLPRTVLEAADHPASHFRLRSVLSLDESRVVSLLLERRPDVLAPGSSPLLRLRRVPLPGTTEEERAHEWILEEPAGVAASAVRALSFVSRLASLEAKSFGAEQPSGEELALAGLEPPSAVVTIGLQDGTTRRLAIGDPSPRREAWARAGDGPIVEVRMDVARDALLPDEFWRDNRVVRLPRFRLVNLQVLKKGLDVEMAREPEAPWRLVRPGDAEVPAKRADELIAALDDLLCGRFEDELAADPAALARRWDFAAPGSFRLQALALLPDGTPRRADVELTPFVREREVFFAVRSSDEMGRVEACVTTEKAVDDVLEKAAALRDLAAAGP